MVGMENKVPLILRGLGLERAFANKGLVPLRQEGLRDLETRVADETVTVSCVEFHGALERQVSSRLHPLYLRPLGQLLRVVHRLGVRDKSSLLCRKNGVASVAGQLTEAPCWLCVAVPVRGG